MGKPELIRELMRRDIEVARLKKGYSVKGGWFREGVRHFLRLEYQVIAELSSKWPVAALCDEMSVNRTGFYKWLRRQPSPFVLNP